MRSTSEGEERHADQQSAGAHDPAEQEPERHEQEAAGQGGGQARGPDAHPDQLEGNVGDGLEKGRQDEVQEPLALPEVAEQRHLASVGDPAPLVGDVADPGVVVGVRVQEDQAQRRAGQEHRDDEEPG
jgi:hypothetical protein